MLKVSRATAGFLERGHPWIRPDRFTSGLNRLERGDPCILALDRRAVLARALADPGATICARVYGKSSDPPFDPTRAAVQAWKRRSMLIADPATNCYRLVHGEADGLPGLRVDRFANRLSAVVTATCILPHLDPILAALSARVPGSTVVVHELFDDVRVAEVRSRAWGGAAWADAETTTEGLELGVRYPLRPAAGIASGLYVDQRMNRAWLRGRCRDASVLNLFSYTGAFSISLLAAGATTAVDVDLSAPALERAEQTARLNGVESRHRTARCDAREFVSNDRQAYDIVIIDPPTSAQGAGGWVARRDYPELLQGVWPRVAPGGLLLATSNQLGQPFPLREALEEACRGGQPASPPPIGPDVPQLPGFPEGLPFTCAAMVRSGSRARQ